VSTNFTTLALLCDAVLLGGEYINASALFKALYITKRVTKLTPPPQLANFGSVRVDRKAAAGQWKSSSASCQLSAPKAPNRQCTYLGKSFRLDGELLDPCPVF
jgi:hypothetical protein